MIRAVLWDFGGVVLTSPFDAFAAYEREVGLPDGFLRTVNATDPDRNAWARLERGELDAAGFASAFEAEASALGGTVSGQTVLALLAGEVRPSMVRALRSVNHAGYRTACLTNNPPLAAVAAADDRVAALADVMALFDVVIESSVVGVRKPEPRFYELACDALAVEPDECVFLDDLGVNLKPARAMGMTTIKVDDPDEALRELETLLGLALR